MEKYFINYNQALALKELGFKERCSHYFDHNKFKIHNEISGWDFNTSFITCVSAPLKSQVFKWFREEHGIWVTFEYDDCDCVEANVCWYVGKCFRYGIGPLFLTNELNDFKTYEEAESACIDKLIEIIKKK